ncbi:MAG TPA: HepT-like ribonuclease domain-containing protein [Haloplasmataceae bacterium]
MDKINNIFIEEILTTITKIKTKLNGITYDDFKSDYKLVEDIIRYLNIIGEASKHISEDIKEKYQEVPWDIMLDLRDILNNPDHINLVWNIATEKLHEINLDLHVAN